MKKTKSDIKTEMLGTVNDIVADLLGSQFEAKLRKAFKQYKQFSDDVPRFELGDVIAGSYETWFDLYLIWPDGDGVKVEIEVAPKIKAIEKL